MLIKVYRAAPEGERKYSPAEVASVEVVPVMGHPDPDRICTSIIERSNLSLRMGAAPVHPADECIQQKVGEPLGRCFGSGIPSTTSAGFTNRFGLRPRWLRGSLIEFGKSAICWLREVTKSCHLLLGLTPRNRRSQVCFDENKGLDVALILAYDMLNQWLWKRQSTKKLPLMRGYGRNSKPTTWGNGR